MDKPEMNPIDCPKCHRPLRELPEGGLSTNYQINRTIIAIGCQRCNLVFEQYFDFGTNAYFGTFYTNLTYNKYMEVARDDTDVLPFQTV